MKKNVSLLFLMVSLLFLAVQCSDTPANDVAEEEAVIQFEIQQNIQATLNTIIPLEVIVTEPLNTVELFFNDSIVESWKDVEESFTANLKTSYFGVGEYGLVIKAKNEKGEEFIDNRTIEILSDVHPEILRAEVIREYPHDPNSFTQGLEFYKGDLYEGTGDPGNQGNTVVAKVDLNSGSHDYSMGLQAGFFGEGITILNDKLYQLTWQNQKCYVYDVTAELQLLNEFNYIGEGWGLCNDGKSLIMSNGSERITFRDPETFQIQRTISVYNKKGKIINLNELEYHDGMIYANVWTTNIIIGIDPITGVVLKQIDATDLVLLGKGTGEVLNGIAVKDDEFYLTGKNWSKLFKVKFIEPGA